MILGHDTILGEGLLRCAANSRGIQVMNLYLKIPSLRCWPWSDATSSARAYCDHKILEAVGDKGGNHAGPPRPLRFVAISMDYCISSCTLWLRNKHRCWRAAGESASDGIVCPTCRIGW